MKVSLTVKDILTEVGTLVGSYGNMFRIDETQPAAEQVYCVDLANNGYTSDSLLDRWVVLKTTGGNWVQRKINRFENNILYFRAASGSSVIFAHTDARLYLFDRAAPEVMLRTMVPTISAFPHLAQVVTTKRINPKDLVSEFKENVDDAYDGYAPEWEGPHVDEDARVAFYAEGTKIVIGISDIMNVLYVRDRYDVKIPTSDYTWEYLGEGTLSSNGVLSLDPSYVFYSYLSVIGTTYTRPEDYSISDWDNEVASLETSAKECLKYYCAARWMSATLPSRDEEGWNYAKKTETHFRNRAAELEPVMPSVNL